MLALPVVLLSLLVVALAKTVEVDDRDSRIVYTGNWTTGGASDEFQGTTSYTLERGATARFTFTGTSLQIIGSEDGAPPNPTGPITFQLDGGTESTFDATVADNARNTNVLFFSAPGLALVEHTILMTNQGGKFVIDKIVYEEPDSTTTNPPTPVDTNTSTPGGETTAPTTTPSSSDPATSPATTTDTNTQSRAKQTSIATTKGTASSSTPSNTGTPAASSTPPNLAVIVGASVGGVGVLALIFLAVVIVKKRKNSPQSEKIDLEVQQTYPLMATPPPQPSSTAPYDPFAGGPNRDLSPSAAPSQSSIAGQPPIRPADELGYDTSLLQYLDNPSQPTPPPWGPSPPTPGREGTPYAY